LYQCLGVAFLIGFFANQLHFAIADGEEVRFSHFLVCKGSPRFTAMRMMVGGLLIRGCHVWYRMIGVASELSKYV
jgi:hypothetical protein